MAIDYHDLTAITKTLKAVYGEGMTNQFPDEQITYNQFPKSDRKPAGIGYEFGVRKARTQSAGARGESHKLPDPLAGKYDKGRINPKYIYGAIRMTGPTIEASKGNTAAFVDGLSDSVNDIYESIVNDMNRQCHGDGFGLIATLSAVTDTVTVSGSTTWTVTCDNDVGTMYMQEGMLVDFFESTTFDVSSGASRISSVDSANKTAEMEPNAGDYATNHPTLSSNISVSAATIASGAYMVKMGTRASTHATSNTAYEITGLRGIYDDGTLLDTFENINADSNPFWRANILGNSSVNRELSLDLMLQALDVTRQKSGKRVKRMRMGLGQRRKYANLLLPDVRFQPGKLKGGYEILTFAGGDGSVEIMIDPLTYPNQIYCEPDGVIQKYELSPLGWGNLDQQIHQRAGYDEWDQFLRIYTNLGCEQRNCLTLLKDLVEPSLWS